MKKFAGVIVGLALGGYAACGLNIAQAADPSAWMKRCEGADCEIVQRLMDGQSETRVLEMAIGFPDGPARGRGVIILPLGVDVLGPLTLQIDDGTPVPFAVRYCLGDGCYAFLDISADLLAQMKKGQMGAFSFQTFDGRPARLPLSLDGLSAAVQSLQP